MINHNLKCIFVEIPKTGSTSIRSIVGVPPRPHLSIVEIQKQITKQQFNEYFKFAFVRNPWDRELSLYKYILKTPIHERYKQCKASGSFLNFIKTPRILQQQFNLISKQEKDQMNFIGRFENLQQDFDIVCDKIGIPVQQLPHENKTDHKHYIEYYNNETKNIVAQRYAKDIEYFGYEFGD